MINLSNLSLRRGTKVLLEHANWTIHAGQRIAMIGANGSGKSSLFALLLGKLEADSGDCFIPTGIRLAHVKQETPALEQSALDYVIDGDTVLRNIEKKLSQAEADNNGTLIAELHGELGHIDGYTAPARAATLLAGLGFNAAEQQKPVKAFSGGWRMRLNLGQALMAPSDVLLLDEPTNHLDLDAIIWLEQWLLKYSGTLLLISHDQEFIDKLATHVTHLEHKNLQHYTGNYTEFERLRAQKMALQQAMHEKQQKHIAHMQKFVDRFRAKASKAAQAQSRVKAIEKMQIIGAAHVDTPFRFHFRAADKYPNPLLNLYDVCAGYADKTVIKSVDLNLSPNVRLGLLGPNGAGKSTLIKIIAGSLAPLSGERFAADDLRVGYFAQHQVDHLNSNDSPMELMREIDPKTSEQAFRQYLGSYNFQGNKVFDPITHFSGGEKSRLALALIIWQKPNLLLLDEPTNHLDMDMRQALTHALQEYQGGLIVVSHDRQLIRTTCDQLAIIFDGELHDFDGDLEGYQRWLFDRLKKDEPKPVAKKTNPKQQRKQDAKLRQQHTALTQKIKILEKNMATAQTDLDNIENQLADNALYNDEQKETLQNYLKQQANLREKLEAYEQDWLKCQAELERFWSTMKTN